MPAHTSLIYPNADTEVYDGKISKYNDSDSSNLNEAREEDTCTLASQRLVSRPGEVVSSGANGWRHGNVDTHLFDAPPALVTSLIVCEPFTHTPPPPCLWPSPLSVNSIFF